MPTGLLVIAPAPLPVYRDAEVVGAPEVDDDHAEEESYVPFEIAGLMTDASVAYSRTVAPMTHPRDRVSLNDYSAVLDDAECTAIALARIIGDQFADTGI